MRLSPLAGLILAAAPLRAQADSAYRAWNQPVAPFRIAGNLYYVGALEVSSFLITTGSGLIVIDGGFEETAPQILANIERVDRRIKGGEAVRLGGVSDGDADAGTHEGMHDVDNDGARRES